MMILIVEILGRILNHLSKNLSLPISFMHAGVKNMVQEMSAMRGNI
jgi:hypothetical protein